MQGRVFKRSVLVEKWTGPLTCLQVYTTVFDFLVWHLEFTGHWYPYPTLVLWALKDRPTQSTLSLYLVLLVGYFYLVLRSVCQGNPMKVVEVSRYFTGLFIGKDSWTKRTGTLPLEYWEGTTLRVLFRYVNHNRHRMFPLPTRPWGDSSVGPFFVFAQSLVSGRLRKDKRRRRQRVPLYIIITKIKTT